jgi:hypothetical protein
MLRSFIKFNFIFSYSFCDTYNVKIEKKGLNEFLNLSNFHHLFLGVMFLNKFVDDGSLQRWIYFFMKKDDITLIETFSLMEAFLSSLFIVFQSMQLTIQWNHWKKIMNDETSLEGRWINVGLVNVLDLYEEKWKWLDKFFLPFKHWIHIYTEHHL